MKEPINLIHEYILNILNKDNNIIYINLPIAIGIKTIISKFLEINYNNKILYIDHLYYKQTSYNINHIFETPIKLKMGRINIDYSEFILITYDNYFHNNEIFNQFKKRIHINSGRNTVIPDNSLNIKINHSDIKKIIKIQNRKNKINKL